jgi:hypothetical protein
MIQREGKRQRERERETKMREKQTEREKFLNKTSNLQKNNNFKTMMLPVRVILARYLKATMCRTTPTL